MHPDSYPGISFSGENVKAATEPPVGVAVREQRDTVDKLAALVQELAERVGPALRPPEPLAQVGEDRISSPVPLASEIEGNTRRLQEISANVADLVRRLAL